MTEKRIVGGLLMSAALVFGVVGCPPGPPDENDGGVGGSATGGGTATGGSASGGGASVCTGATVASLPVMNTKCDTEGESLCEPSGDRCICLAAHWRCTTLCASAYPTVPAPGSACIEGAVCNYPAGVGCTCQNSQWLCIGTSDCPADLPTSGTACDGLAGRQCDYPNQNPTFHMWCLCSRNGGTSTGSSWICVQSGDCPATQPLAGTDCPQGFTTCIYGSNRCNCSLSDNPWYCGLGALWVPALGEVDISCGTAMCSLQNVAAFGCQDGVCAPSCRTGWLDVNRPTSGADDGCETLDLETNIDNCGAMGRRCSSENVAAFSCQGGVCTSFCRTGWLNVSQPASGPDDGCETVDPAANVAPGVP